MPVEADAVHEPLISDDQRPTRISEEVDGYGSEHEGTQPDEEAEIGTPGLFIWTLVLGSAVSGLLFGYDTGVISSTLLTIRTDLSERPLSTFDKSIVTSITSLLALFASPLAGLLADAWGRRFVVLTAAILFVLGAMVQAAATTVWVMVIGRGLVGGGVGMGSFVVPLYISELSPAPFRGRLVTVASLFITGGQVVAYVIGWLFSEVDHGWRWMVGLGAAPALVQLVALGFLPETPRWLVKAGRREQARKVLEKVYGVSGSTEVTTRKGKLVKQVLDNVIREVEEEEREAPRRAMRASTTKMDWRSWFEGVGDGFTELTDVGANKRALIIACMLQGLQQLCGFNSLMYFSATIFSLVGFTSPTLTSLSIAVTNFIFTLAAFHLIDRVGRRRILLLSIPFMVLGLAACAFAFQYVPLVDADDSHQKDNGPDVRGPWPMVLLISMVLYVASYAIGLGNVPWQQSELFALPVRAVGSALATATNWTANFVVGLTFLPMLLMLGPVITFGIYALVCVVGLVVVHRIYPETAGLGLEEVGGLLAHSWGVEESVHRWKRARSSR